MGTKCTTYNNSYECIKCSKPVSTTCQAESCDNCEQKVNKHCAKQYNVAHRNKIYCHRCLKCNDILKYNPFFDVIEALVNDYDKSYLQNQTAEDDREALLPLNSILEKCRINSLTDFNDQNNFHNPSTNSIMCKFLNIDGNAANFDSLLTTLQSMKSDFFIMGLAETNIDSSISETYKIPQYNSLYLNKINDKKKVSGVAMYILDSIDFNTNETMSKCNSDIESLFISINSTEIPIHVGTVYRPPSGDLKKFF